MIAKKHGNLLLPQPAVVGAMHCVADLKVASNLEPGAVDVLELRVDALLAHRKMVAKALAHLKHPILLTVRDASEGGCAPLSTAQRLLLYEEFLEQADMVDIELRFLRNVSLKKFATKALARKTILVCSFHDFRKTPPLSTLHALASRAVDAGADILKIATQTETPEDLTRLLRFLNSEKRCPLSVMGMGAQGKISRLVLARCGSVLNYGFLKKAQVPGQWPAVILKKRLQEL